MNILYISCRCYEKDFFIAIYKKNFYKKHFNRMQVYWGIDAKKRKQAVVLKIFVLKNKKNKFLGPYFLYIGTPVRTKN